MLRRLSAAVVLACGLGWGTALAADQHSTLAYQLTPILERGIEDNPYGELRFKGESDGETMLHLPDDWGGQSELWRALTDLDVDGEDARMLAGPSASRRVIKHAPGADLVVTYRIFQDVPGEPKVSDHNPYRSILQPDYFHLLGNAIFAFPEWDDNPPATFELRDLPSGWRFASDLEHVSDGRSLRLEDIVESVLVAGDFRIVSRPAPNGFLRLAVRGTWRFTDDELANKIARIVLSHNAFWRDPNDPFLVTLLPVVGPPGSQSLGGTGRGDAFALFATDNNPDNVINRILAHEHIHTWIPRSLGRMPSKDEARDYWLSEGFTDFYANRLLVRDGIWSIEEFAEAMNETLFAYWSSPVRAEPNARIVADFWRDPSVGKLPYQRGFLLGFIFDQQLRRESDGASDLDDVMLAMKARVASFQGTMGGPLAVDNFVETMREAGVDPSKRLARHIEKGDVILLPSDVLKPCGTLATLDLPEFTRGFDPERTAAAGNVVTGIDPDGPAYAAGMRDGMRIIKRESGKPGDSRVELVYRVDDRGTERIIRFKPEGKKRVTLQEFQLAPNLNRTACAKRLGGT